jgi:hypothetical protein
MAIAAASALGACTGMIGDGGPSLGARATGSSPASAEAGVPAAVQAAEAGRIRRLTNREWTYSVQDIFGDTTSVGILPTDATNTGFDNDFNSMSMSDLVVQNIETMAESVASGIGNRLSTLLPCSATSPVSETACVTQFITQYGRLTYRRALTANEQSQLLALFAAARGQPGELVSFQTAVQTVASAMLQSPNFLYRTELGPTNPGAATIVRLTPYELASELSYYLWSGPPDDALLTSAETGGLDDDAGVTAAVTRLLQDPRAQRSVSAFFRQWLLIDNPDSVSKSQALYPTFSNTVSESLVTETTMFVNDVIFNRDSSLTTLLTSTQSFANRDVAAIYGLANGPTGSTFVPVSLDPTERAGVLTQPSFLAANTDPGDVTPVFTGKAILENLFCHPLPPPPNNVPPLQPPAPGLSARARFQAHVVGSCASCHTPMDGAGWTLEQYDGIGRWRTTDEGSPLTGIGTLIGTDVDGPVVGGVGLAQKLIASTEVKQCFNQQYFMYAFGRLVDSSVDAPSTTQTFNDFVSGNVSVKVLIASMAKSPAFLYRTPPTLSTDGGL